MIALTPVGTEVPMAIRLDVDKPPSPPLLEEVL